MPRLTALEALECHLEARQELDEIEAMYGIHTDVPAWTRRNFLVFGSYPQAYFYSSSGTNIRTNR